MYADSYAISFVPANLQQENGNKKGEFGLQVFRLEQQGFNRWVALSLAFAV